jgi:hypothetical protein
VDRPGGRGVAAADAQQLESYLPAAGIELSTDVLDRIDEIVVPGVTVNPDDNSCGAHELTTKARRR